MYPSTTVSCTLERYCDAGDFQCSSKGRKPQCVPEQWLCDGYVDCVDFSDESIKTCGRGEEIDVSIIIQG